MIFELGTYIFAASDEHAMTIIVADARVCPFCQVRRSCFVNRDGRTRCFCCDDKYKPTLVVCEIYGLLEA